MQSYKYEKKLVFGEIASFSSLPTLGFSHYNKVFKEEVGSPIIDTKGSYIRWTNKSLLSYKLDENHLTLQMGHIVSDNGKAKVDLNVIEDDMLNKEYFSSKIDSTNNVYIFGSEHQGLGGSIELKSIDNLKSLIDTKGEYKNKDSIYGNASYSRLLNGFANTDTLFATPLKLTVENNSGIEGSINNSINISGSIEDNTAAYIRRNIFASTGFSGTYNDYDVTNGWLVTGQSKALDVEGYDNISWGFWNVNYDENGDIPDTSDIGLQTWVAGKNRVEDIIATLGTDYVGTYTGYILGSVHGDINGILNPLKSTISLALDFGAGTINANVNAVLNNTNESISSVKSFSGSDFSVSDSIYQASMNDGSDLIKGSFYKQGDVTAGSFKFTEESNVISGVYKAGKVTP